MSQSPFAHLRVQQQSTTLAGRLAGLLLADQGAEVYASDYPANAHEGIDEYLDRGKTLLPVAALEKLVDADIVIIDGDRLPSLHLNQITLGFTAVAPGEHDIDVPDNASDDLLNALLGFYTDLGITSRLLGPVVTYTPLPLCSIYAAVLGACAVSAALVHRQKAGVGTAIVVPRLAAGLSAIGVLAMKLDGLKSHLVPPQLLGLPPEIIAALPDARKTEDGMLRLLNELNPTAGCYRTSDGKLVMPVTTVNRRLAQAMLAVLNLEDRAEDAGFLNVTPYDPSNVEYADHNLALPQAIRNDLNVQLAQWMTETFATRTADDWECAFAKAHVPFGTVNTFSEWMASDWARASALVTTPLHLTAPQIGRSVFLDSARPYPPLNAPNRTDVAPYFNSRLERSALELVGIGKPLDGYAVLDLANVIAGPACGRLLAELGARVTKVDTTRPDHQPVVTVGWGAEANQGKDSILLDAKTPSGREVLHQLITCADIVVMNETDEGVRRLGLTREVVASLNPRAVVVQISAFKGEQPSEWDDRPGYDPLLQAITGIMSRFGTSNLPLLHGIASCVDYLTGYLGAFAALAALQARERRGEQRGDWAETSLAAGAALIQMPFQWQPPAPSATGPRATGPHDRATLRQVRDGWVFIEVDEGAIPDTNELNVQEAIAFAKYSGARAVPVRSIAELRTIFLAKPSATIRFRSTTRQGLQTTLLVPTWFQFDGAPLPAPFKPGRPGADAETILAKLGYSQRDIHRMKAEGAVGETDWMHLEHHAVRN
ncbi:hypothetical protein DWU98_13045 [Dyella monticola]|uniref:CoA transferase n=1 Tax=Dyella monticola TaxID=1927958 RepID=A0A370WY10_9GAMM|nr:CoA transferase [Dyella monticola]RDS80865.1 hypothetical protein DWU98_13045 [Dyella monticola]